MSESNLKVITNDMHVLVKDAQILLHDAATLTGAKAEEARARGMQLLDRAVVKAQDVQTSTVIAGKEMAASANDYIRENPWRTMAALAGAAMLFGAFLGRK